MAVTATVIWWCH